MSILESCAERASSLLEVSLAVAFGSMARGEEHPGSDLDLGVLLAEDSPAARRRVEAELGRAAGRAVDVVFLADAPPLLRFEIARDGVLLAERGADRWADFKARAMIDWWDW